MKRTILLVGAILASLVPAPSAFAAPTIEFLSPSNYANGTAPPKISDAQDRDASVHLVAWARDVPSSALVEFELERSTGGNAATFTGERVGPDTWEFFMPIPDTNTEGAYTVRARLYSGVPGDADEVDNAEITVNIDHSNVPPPTAETVELSYPDNGGRLGLFVPKGKRPISVFDYQASPATEQVRAFYTLSDPGAKPVWEASCGFATPDDGGFGQVPCQLKEGHNPLDVTAVAVVSNKTAPPAPPNEQLDDTGDTHRVVPYLQVPSSVEIAQGNVNVPLSACHLMTAFVNDEFGRPIADANVDIHADGPQDELHFGSRLDGAVAERTDPMQAPDSQHVSKESAKRCSNNENLGQQGDHNSPGRDDLKHVESIEGTRDNGSFKFALRSDFAGGTFITAWADVDDDDLPDLSEASGGTQIGWATPPPPPVVDIFLNPSSTSATNGSCVEFEILARRGGTAFNSANVDIHLSGPDAAVDFCDVAGGSPRRDPESGGHLGDIHEDSSTRHNEGETDAAGRLLFGVRSATSGTTQVQVWIDTTEDDVLNAEPTKSGSVSWSPPGDRSISIGSSRSTVAKGRRVRLTGAIQGDPACSSSQIVNIQSKPVRGGRFATVKTVTSNSEGGFTTRIRMRASKNFRAVTPAAGPCSFARSDTVTVRVRS